MKFEEFALKFCFFVMTLLRSVATHAQSAELSISVTAVISTSHAPFILKVHDAKMDAYPQVMLQSDSGSVKRISEFKMT